jgi:diguanylate cyclase (GGDEF)-like protein
VLREGVRTELRILIVEDVAAEAEVAAYHLRAAGLRCTVRRVERESEFREALVRWHPNVVLSDFSLPEFDGMEALQIAASVAPEIPFLFISGTIGEERAIKALKCGAIDYVLKSNPARIGPAVRRALEEVDERRARQAAERRVLHMSRVLQMLSGVNAAVVRITDRKELLNEACRLAHRVGGYSFAFVALVDPGTGTARPVAAAGENVQELQDVVFSLNDSDSSVIGAVMRTGEATISAFVPNAGTGDPTDTMFSAAQAYACLPLKVDGTPVGALMFGARPGAEMDEEELRLLGEVASNLSFALQYLDKRDEVRFLSYFDPLTGLAKRALFCERVGRLLGGAGEGASPRPSVLVFDLEQLSTLNDAFGRHVGDLLLQCVADRLKDRLHGTDRAAHLSGGTFAALFSPEQSNELRQLRTQVAEMFAEPFVIQGRQIPVSVCSGIATYPENGQDAATLVHNAEAALKTAKASGEKMLRHKPGMNSALAERLAVEHRLRVALDRRQFVLHYQPKVSLSSGRIVGVEALLRWMDPMRGLMAPNAFLPILESTGLIGTVGEWAVKQAAEDCARWSSLGFPPVRVAVNAAPVQLRRRDFAAKVIDAAGVLDAQRGWGLDIEITEGALLDDASWTLRTLRVLRGAGIRIAIDDFGTGYSSLSRLSQLPVDTLKIDRSFTSRLPGNQAGCTVVTTIISLARAFDMSTVAEGVETHEQLAFLQRAGCTDSQGYLHSRPIPAAEFELLLTQHGDLRVTGRSNDEVGVLRDGASDEGYQAG